MSYTVNANRGNAYHAVPTDSDAESSHRNEDGNHGATRIADNTPEYAARVQRCAYLLELGVVHRPEGDPALPAYNRRLFQRCMESGRPASTREQNVNTASNRFRPGGR